MYYKRSKRVTTLSIITLVLLGFGVAYATYNNIEINIFVFIGFFALTVMFMVLNNTHKMVPITLVITLIASSIIISPEYTGFHFDITNPLLFLTVAYFAIDKRTFALVFSGLATGSAVLALLFIIELAPEAIIVFLGSIMFYVTALLNVVNIHNTNRGKSQQRVTLQPEQEEYQSESNDYNF